MEPWYESTEITAPEVKLIIQQGWFHRELFADHNQQHSNAQLCKLLYDDKRKLSRPYKHVTFEAIRAQPGWQQHANDTLDEEIDKEGSFGSHRGFYTFCREPLMRAYAKGVIQECWAKPVLANFARKWLEHHYAYGNSGFLNARTSFETVASR
jgi:hypothetical protein